MKISIIGAAGSIGAPAAFCIGENQLADTITMIDLPGDGLDFHVFDLTTAVSNMDINVVSGGLEMLEGTSIVVMTAAVPMQRVSSRQEMLSANLSLTVDVAQSIRQYCPNAILIHVSNPIEPLAYATYRIAGLKRESVIGYSINDTFRLRMLLAESLKIEASKVDAIVIGEHGATQVPLFSQVKVDGNPVEISEEAKQHFFSETPEIYKKLEYFREKTGRTAGWTSAIGITKIVKAIVTDSKEVLPCSTILDGKYGVKDICLGVPAVIGAGGVESIVELSLSPEEKKAFDHSAETIRKAIANAMETLTKNGPAIS
jgi:malate dehydrogenase